MRLLSMLLALIIIGLLLYKQLNSQQNATQHQLAADGVEQNVPQVPTNPKDIKQFKSQVNDLVQDAAAKQRQQIDNIDKATKQDE